MEPASLVETYIPRKSSRRDHWSEQEAREALSAAARSGLSLAAFARRHGLNDNQLYWWHMRLRKHPDVHSGSMSFVPMVAARGPETSSASGVEVAVGGFTLRLTRGFCEQALVRAVVALRGLPPC